MIFKSIYYIKYMRTFIRLALWGADPAFVTDLGLISPLSGLPILLSDSGNNFWKNWRNFIEMSKRRNWLKAR
jgi:hypothetical protein